MEATITSKTMSGIKTCLENRGFEILEEGWAHGNNSVDFITHDDEDENTLVFISCGVICNSGNGFPEDRMDRDAIWSAWRSPTWRSIRTKRTSWSASTT